MECQRSLKRLMKELQQLQVYEGRPGGCRQAHGFEAAPVDESDLHTWEMRLYDFEKDQPVAEDMRKRRIDHLALRIHFPEDFPTRPPFVHMLRPRLQESTGYVLGGGGICMELLTEKEWSPATSVSALAMSIRSMMLVGNVRLRDTKPGAIEHDYHLEEAKRDFAHIVKVHKQHGWTSHPKFKNG